MRRAVLADSGPLYAAVDIDDQYHTRAQEELERLERESRLILVGFPTLLECYSLVLHRLGILTAHRWLEEMLVGASLLNPTQEDYAAAAAKIRAYGDQLLTMFDGVLAVLSSRFEVPVWTYDHHFEVMRVEVWR